MANDLTSMAQNCGPDSRCNNTPRQRRNGMRDVCMVQHADQLGGMRGATVTGNCVRTSYVFIKIIWEAGMVRSSVKKKKKRDSPLLF